MPYSVRRDRWGNEEQVYYDPIKKREFGHGLDLIVHEPMQYWMGPQWIDKYDLFNEFPVLERLDYNRLVFETHHGIKARNDEWLRESQKLEWSAHWEYCCWPIGCVLNAAMGNTLHLKWVFAFNKQLPYWETRTIATH